MKTFLAIKKTATLKQGEEIVGYKFVPYEIDLNPHFMISAKEVNMGKDFHAKQNMIATRIALSNKEVYFVVNYHETLKGKNK